MLDTSQYRIDKVADRMQKAAVAPAPADRCRACDGQGRIATGPADGVTPAVYRHCGACDGRGYRQG